MRRRELVRKRRWTSEGSRHMRNARSLAAVPAAGLGALMMATGLTTAPAAAEASSRRGSMDCKAAESRRQESGVISNEWIQTMPQNE